MNKKVTVLSIVGLILVGLGVGLFICNPFILKAMEMEVYTVDDIFINFMAAQKLMFGAYIPLATWVATGVGGLFIILWVIHLIILIVKKHPISVWQSVGWFLLGTVMTYAAYILMFNLGDYTQLTEGQFKGIVEALGGDKSEEYARLITANQGGYFPVVTINYEGTVTTVVNNQAGGYFTYIFDLLNAKGINVGALILLLAPFVLVLVGFVLCIVAHISDMVYICEEAERRSVTHDDYGTAASTAPVVVIHDDETNETPNGDEIRAIMHDELEQSENGKAAPAVQPAPVQGSVSTTGFSGPFLIQYINTYNPGESKSVERKGVSPRELDENVNGEKNLSADDIRRIIKEELEAKNEPAQPVIVTVPSQAEPVADKPLSAEEIRAIIKDELSVKEEDVIVEEMEEEPAPLTAEAIRDIIREELAPKEEEKVEEEPEEEIELIEEKDIREIIREELTAFHADKEEAERKAAEEEAARKAAEEEAAKKAAEEEAARKAEEEAERARKAEEEARKAEEALTADDIRQIIAEELSKAAPKEEKEDLAITAEAIREIIRSELKAVEPIKEEEVEPVAVVVEEPKPEPAPAAATPITVVINNPTPAEEPKPEPKPEPAPAPVEDEAKKIERIPFPTRMLTADKDLQANYNQLKSEILSYGVKSRVSNSGDTFRLHKVTYVKITIAGKSLKLYFALNPKDYENSPIPVQDAGHKDIYKEIPLVFKVKSELSLRRASQLISDCMEKGGLEQGKLEPINWVKELVDYKPAGSN